MKKTIHLAAVIIATCLCTVSYATADPSDHLAPIPQTTPDEKEVIDLLQLGKPLIQNGGLIIIPLYNPTKYLLKSCVVRVQLPSVNINRIYYSTSGDIPPLKDGQFEITTQIINSNSKELKIDILKLTYEKPKS